MKALLVLVTAVLLAMLLTFIAQSGHNNLPELSTFAICAIVTFVIQWCVFIPSYLLKTERVYDLTGSLTFIIVIFVAINSQQTVSITSILLAAMVVAWAARLGTFLFLRINNTGVDGRFDDIKPDKYRFFSAWTLQGLWILIMASAALTVISSPQAARIDALTLVGVAIWLIGFAIEVIADQQKTRFKQDPLNQGQFIQTGLWAYSRHPNYFGEIVLWIGVAIAAYPALEGWQLITLSSPLFIILLLTKVSGIPMLEKRADEKWANNPDYQKYITTTPVLIPRINCRWG
ncbi:DUF1295 domain-containing protein [Aliiglaciecola litoralis]|uniref:DUF1295 domain-containing protein n=2 Tax=Aliiglaciecola litoralis TaxID=582857 RepID=A0ABP3WZI8_9ALTE